MLKEIEFIVNYYSQVLVGAGEWDFSVFMFRLVLIIVFFADFHDRTLFGIDHYSPASFRPFEAIHYFIYLS